MSENSDHDHKWYTDRSVQLTILGVAGTIIAAVISVLPQFIGNSQPPEPTQAPIIWTATVVELPTETMEPTLPSTEIATLEPTETTVPTSTPTPTSITPPISCLDRWQVVSSNPDLAETSGSGDCSFSSVPGLGISASRDGINFGVINLREQGTFGIATTIPNDATITLTLSLTALSQGEFWLALSNDPNPENNMAIIALQPQLGDIKVYENRTDIFTSSPTWEQLSTDTGLFDGTPYTFNVKFTTRGNNVDSQIHFFNLPSLIVNLPKYLFLGFNNKSNLSSISVQVEVSDLTVEIE